MLLTITTTHTPATDLGFLLHKNPARRYASADALLEELGRYRAGLPVQARPDSQLYRAGKFVRRHRLGVAAGAAVFLSLVGGLAGTLWQARAASRAAAAASREAAKAREVTQFVVGLFSVSNPEQSRGREITARELLETLASIIKKLESDPGKPTLIVSIKGAGYAWGSASARGSG